MEKCIKILLILLVSITSQFNLFATTPYSVKGILVDSVFNEGEPFVTLRIYHEKQLDTPIIAGVTDEFGKFQQDIPNVGKYNIIFTAVGRQTLIKEFEISETSPIADLGILSIKDNQEILDEIVVTARKPLVKAETDKLVYDNEEDPAAKTNTLLEMLRKVPMVTVDGDDNIKLNGSSNFKIYINGKPDPMLSKDPKQILKALPASTIKKLRLSQSREPNMMLKVWAAY